MRPIQLLALLLLLFLQSQYVRVGDAVSVEVGSGVYTFTKRQ